MADFKRRFKDLLGFGGNESVAYDDYDADDDYDGYFDRDSNEEADNEYDTEDSRDSMSASAPQYSAKASGSQAAAGRTNRTESRSNSYSGNSANTSDRSRILSMGATSNLRVVLSKPMEFDDCQGVCSHLRAHMTVVLNLEFVRNVADRRRIFDFVSGCCFALDCNIQRVSELIYVIAPCDVDVFSEADDEDESEAFTF